MIRADLARMADAYGDVRRTELLAERADLGNQ